MKSHDLRRSFMNYFKDLNHTQFESSSLIPDNDPTLLFTVAGMVQFKPMFAGLSGTDVKRAASIQKCLRVVDIEEVGKSPFHDTFFEMLGNFSFGDYFQKESIEWAWKYLTGVIKIDSSRLYVTVHKDDEEAYKIWRGLGLSDERIVKMGDRTNFWGPAGGTGACGPSSEIFYDFGPELSDRNPCSIENDCRRYLEIWNIVFPQFNQDKEGNRHPLKNRGIDTGMGLERLATVMQEKKSIFQTDLFLPIIDKFCSDNNIDYEKYPSEVNSIADHIRALTFSISDGAIPENEGRGYVVRRILRRAVRLAYKMGIEKPFLFSLSSSVYDIMKDQYPLLKEEMGKVASIIQSEEERFLSTIGQGMSLYDYYKSRMESKIISGETLFKLYDTFGFPPDLVKQMAEEDGYDTDEEGFNSLLQEARERSRSERSFDEGEKTEWTVIKEDVSEFQGYDSHQYDSGLLMYRFHGSGRADMIFEKTPFYAESGGQVGDTGIIEKNGFRMKVENTVKSALGNLSYGQADRESFDPSGVFSLKVDERRRESIRRNHTATHLLHSGLRRVLGEHVKQQGSHVSDERLRFDFTHFKPVTAEEIELVEDFVNDAIFRDIKVETAVSDYEDALKSGATALFSEKYDKKVRVVTIDGVSSELCGGTHARRTGEIGMFRILKESSVAAGIRRIEAVTSRGFYSIYRKERRILSAVMMITDTAEEDRLEERTLKLIEEGKEAKKNYDSIKKESIQSSTGGIAKDAVEVKGVKIIIHFEKSADMASLREIMDALKTKEERLCGLIASDSGAVVAFSQNTQLDSGRVLKEILPAFSGKGGGRKDFASGSIPGGFDFSKLRESFMMSAEGQL